MARRLFRCQIQEIKRLDEGLVILRFKPQVAFNFEPGQFTSLEVPGLHKDQETVWRAYSFALPYELSREHGYELCIKQLKGGRAGSYLDTLKEGDWIRVRAAYGDFTFHSGQGRGVCFIGTGTGVAPLRSMALSRQFQKADLSFGLAVLGYRVLGEVPYIGDFERMGITTIYSLSREKIPLEYPFAHGRVTDVLKQMRADFPWSGTDYYICGNPDMIREVVQFLLQKGVPAAQIMSEAFESSSSATGSQAA
ncbi:MAG: FAD-dependent oxidoreductase [Proteobacteria bacterium]|nr:MAG: FAD-dependent oxidoreductase [Pseudomonadota bacterium]